MLCSYKRHLTESRTTCFIGEAVYIFIFLVTAILPPNRRVLKEYILLKPLFYADSLVALFQTITFRVCTAEVYGTMGSKIK